MEKDIRALARQSLVRDKTLEISQKKTLRVVTLTKAGHRLLKNTNQVPDDQPIYHGLVKPREVKHDADLYRLYQKEAARIERGGGRPVRVLLDYELKRNLNRDLALLGPDKDDPDRKSEVAEKHGLQVVNGKIPVPDLRVEYETPGTRTASCGPGTRDARLPAARDGGKSRRGLLALWTFGRRIAFAPRSRRTRNHRRNPHAMNIAPAHLDALKALGYTETEARFLYIVATHSGYFVARQFLAFTDAHWGKRTTPSGANFTPGNTPGPNAFQRAEPSITSSPAASIARSTARTSAIAANTKSNTSSGASQCSISFSSIRGISTSKPSLKKSAFSAIN